MRAFLLRLARWSLAWLVGTLGASVAADWPEFDPAEFERTASPIDPEAGAEVLLREVEINGSQLDQTTTTHFVRVRIYSERGVEKLSKIELPYARGAKIGDIRARTIRPDGTIVELDRDDIYNREVVKSGNLRLKAKSFAPPAIEPGVMVEYHYRQHVYDASWYYFVWFQGDLPVRRVRYRIRALENVPLGVRGLFFNCPNQALDRDGRGYFNFEMTNLPAAEEEPLQPPAVQRQAVALIYYTSDDDVKITPDEHWRREAIDLHRTLQREGKATAAVRAAAAKIVAPGDSPEEKLRKLFVHCRTRIANLDYPPPDQPAPTGKVKRNRTAADTLRQGSGTSHDVTLLFAALARAVGIEARLARCNDRDLIFFNRTVIAPFTVTDLAVAVELDGSWRFYAPGNPYLPPGLLSWNNCATSALVSDPKEGRFVLVPPSEASVSQQQRVANFELQEDGTLEGDVTITYTGHWGEDLRAQFAPEPAHLHEEFVREEVQRNLKLAEVSRVQVSNLTDPENPMTVSFHLRVPAYAERTGSRLFVQPAVFQKGETARFTADKRTTDMIFRYCSTESDQISIQPPPGFALEAASSPGSLDFGALGQYQATVGFTRLKGTLKYSRQLQLGAIVIRREHYAPVKAAMERVHGLDNHVLTLKRKEAGAAAAPASPVPTVDAGVR